MRHGLSLALLCFVVTILSFGRLERDSASLGLDLGVESTDLSSQDEARGSRKSRPACMHGLLVGVHMTN